MSQQDILPERSQRNAIPDVGSCMSLDNSLIITLSNCACSVANLPITVNRFLQADNAREPLNLTKRMFVRIMSYHQVMPQYLDLVALFGSRIRDRDRRFSSFRDYTTLQNAPKGTSMQDLARSGRQFQLCYNLKAINCISDENTSPELKQWSVRQGAFLHQFDVELGTTLWIVTKGKPDPREGRQDIKEQIEELTGPKGRKQDRSFKSAAQSFRSSLSVHLLFCYWAMLDWRWYIQCLEEKVENKTDSIVQELRSNKNSRQTYASEDLMTIQGFEDDINEAIMIMESNNDTLSSLQAYYEKLLKHKHFPSELLTECLDDVQLFATQISGMIHDAKMHISRARLLLKIADDRKTIVRILRQCTTSFPESDHLQLIQHLQSQTTEKMESLNQGMFGIGVQSQKDTVAMRIVTFVTLIYLPATFVSVSDPNNHLIRILTEIQTFFSTDVVKYQPPDNSPVVTNATFSTPAFQGSYSSIALNRWLQVTLPLTMITLMAAVLWYRIDSGKRQKIWIQIAKGENRENLLPLYTTVKEK
ncbi:hypothetical protein M501DRAFT_52755 [Patellaria atrata CBS 101060]|uniref:CorA-like transporter domain-containing protein n=1 Tax=Patellaria atrata CBS 101060 TaxID=1346257 RepID=A0A9P4SJL1_9PEZI|nr:hypothetical protein M501DRAFT_52755 [Patellaria atrata CBS 101060]